ncbi:glycine zipper 2TM domain-containing protein [Avibacterium paragallinarum]|uniref:Glycine zipper 2TM domain-containing protein n=1 Tax=Avibacterium paragallinarum TaxID=728 RepID=A0A0F5EYV3_AVIPA|nr:glycine zipper 2TM domain-containing protein [Avibacterium paragallinarum]KAA6208245.1 glycine zipper 2TM domain-containing protein [Avibacterium paragallinarum]KKB01814.1 membrane protein [Avibacterium paragallinarum]RZN54135.1 glycine zipper 2TM domain-containing protein [Avibacterium paragallinarum]RZN55689.1 glycine zipper 2TM domain-containing protein [Avibacterium paragallinarum]RZN69004.1 glycine zipper 2TM domain-containing protein [Avibacterium paragallinarum]
MKKLFITPLAISALLTGCAVDADSLGADVYDTTQLNSRQEAKTVKIIAVLPAKVAVDNSKNKEIAKTAGSLLGAVAGAVVGYQYNTAGAIGGGVAGATLGGVAGAMVKDKVVIEGVSLTYKQGTKIYTSTQAGKKCQFKPGIALLITTKANETRIQPNAECPVKK